MTVQRILIVSGTHGNEINPVWAVKKFNKEENILNHSIEYEYIIGNPVAYEKGYRYIDLDLNRSFKEKMTVQRILIVSGTHGNEINPVWAVKQFNRKENSLNLSLIHI